MKSLALKTLCIAFTCCGLLNARKQLKENTYIDEREGHPEVSSPMVLDQQFLIGNSQYYWRLDMTPPVLRVGWQTDQSANSKDLTF